MKAARTIGGAVTSLEDVVEEVEENEDDDWILIKNLVR
jgi:hypothetical protein